MCTEARKQINRQRILLEGLILTLTKKAHAKSQNFRHQEADKLYQAIQGIKSANDELFFAEQAVFSDA